MDPRAAVQRLLELQSGDEFDASILDEHFEDTALQLLGALCTCMSFALAGARGIGVRHDQVRQYLAQCVGATNMVLEVWDMADVEIVHEPYFDERELGWTWTN